MSDDDLPWALRGVSQEARAAARAAAEAADQTVGEWLGRLIRDTEAEERDNPPEDGASHDVADPGEIAALRAEVARLERRLAAAEDALNQIRERLDPADGSGD